MTKDNWQLIIMQASKPDGIPLITENCLILHMLPDTLFTSAGPLSKSCPKKLANKSMWQCIFGVNVEHKQHAKKVRIIAELWRPKGPPSGAPYS